MDKEQSKIKSRKKRTVLWPVVLALIAIGLVALVRAALPPNVTDGTENFSGIELRAAQAALRQVREIEEDSISLPIKSKYRVKDVYPAPGQSCLHNSDPNEVAHYNVLIEELWIFGIHREAVRSGCILETWL